jgi:hypothetical protein
LGAKPKRGIGLGASGPIILSMTPLTKVLGSLYIPIGEEKTSQKLFSFL